MPLYFNYLLMRDSKGMDPRRWGGTDRNEKGNCSQKILFEKRICFQKKELGNLLKKEKKKTENFVCHKAKGILHPSFRLSFK